MAYKERLNRVLATAAGLTLAFAAGANLNSERRVTRAGDVADLGASAQPSSSPETTSAQESTFVPRETREGWNRTEIDLIDGSKIEADFKQLPSLGEDVLSIGTIVSGDVKMDGKKLYDNDATTGSITLNQKDGAKIKATYGASMVENYDPAYQNRIIQTLSGQMDEDGCGLADGCENIDPKVYAEDGSVQTYEASSGPVVEPTSSPETSNLTVEEQILLELKKLNEHLADCGCPVCTKPNASPKPTPTEQPCPDFDDIEKAYGGWKPENAPVVTRKVGKAIFQADGLVDGIRRFDNDSSTALITVIDTTKARNHSFGYTYGGDLQPFCVTPEGENQLQEVLKIDIAQTLARSDINKVKVVTITDNGVKSRWINE